MAVQKYEFAYGRGTQSFEYDDADVLKVVRTEPQPILEDVKGHLLDMLGAPHRAPAAQREISEARRHRSLHLQ